MRSLTAPLLLSLALAGCATSPPGTPTTAAHPAPAPAAVAAPAAAAAPIPGGISAELYARAREAGYRARKEDGRTVFCRNEAAIGSRLSREACVSTDALEASLRQAEALRDQMRHGNICGSADCAGK